MSETRATGKTTRVLDKAIQAFFNNGEVVFVPTYHQLKDREEGNETNNPIPSDLKEEQIIVDPDWAKNTAVQRFLKGAIAQRLNFEHMGMARKYKVIGGYIKKRDEETE